MIYKGVHRNVFVILGSKSRSPGVKSSTKVTTEVIHIRVFVVKINQKSLLSGTQEVITYYLKVLE